MSSAPRNRTQTCQAARLESPAPRAIDGDHPVEARAPKVFVVDDEYFAREEICALLTAAGWDVEAFESCEAFLAEPRDHPETCLVLDIHLPGMSGLELLGRIANQANRPPVIVVSGSSGVSEAVLALKGGAVDFIQKPVVGETLCASVRGALEGSRASNRVRALRDASVDHLDDLTDRQRQIMRLVLAGSPSKNIAADLGISRRTVESHRASIMQRAGVSSIPALTRLAMCNECPLVA